MGRGVRRSLNLNSWNVYNKRRSIEQFQRHEKFDNILEFAEHICCKTPLGTFDLFDTVRKHTKKDTTEGKKAKNEEFKKFQEMVKDEWKHMPVREKNQYKMIAKKCNSNYRLGKERYVRTQVEYLHKEVNDIKRSIDQLKEDHCQRKGKSDANTSNDEQFPLDTKTFVKMEMEKWKQFEAELRKLDKEEEAECRANAEKLSDCSGSD